MFYDAITDFIFVEDLPQKADIIFIPGSFCPELARHAAHLYQEAYAPYVLPSGKYSIKKDRAEQLKSSGIQDAGIRIWPENLPDTAVHEIAENAALYATESDFLCAILAAEGVQKQAILREPEATFTWENAIYSRRVTDQAGLTIRRAILCCKAFHARRCLMYYQQQFPDTEFLVCPVVVNEISRESWHRTRRGIDTVLGEVERCGGQFHEILADAAGISCKEWS
ncbi:MAG: YdcF family protein [Lachnospiraceae bacterium]|nr:YdcF family protein [Lachnospiraceae bacterium]